MKTNEVTNDLIGKRVKGIFTAMEVTGTITGLIEDKWSAGVTIALDKPVQWGNCIYSNYQSTSRKIDQFGNLKYTELINS